MGILLADNPPGTPLSETERLETAAGSHRFAVDSHMPAYCAAAAEALKVTGVYLFNVPWLTSLQCFSKRTRVPQMWDRWDPGPSKFEILAATFGYPGKKAADNNWLPVKSSNHGWRLLAKNVFKSKNAIKSAH